MRQYIPLGIVIAILGGLFFVLSLESTVSYDSEHIEQEEEEEVITEPKPEYPAEWLEEAEAAKEAVIQKRKLEAERDELIESRAEIQERITEIEKELNVH